MPGAGEKRGRDSRQLFQKSKLLLVREKISLPHFSLFLEKKSEGSSGAMELRIIFKGRIRRAVDRNRLKRVVREFFRSKRGLLQGQVVICKVDPKAVGVKNAELFQELGKVL